MQCSSWLSINDGRPCPLFNLRDCDTPQWPPTCPILSEFPRQNCIRWSCKTDGTTTTSSTTSTTTSSLNPETTTSPFDPQSSTWVPETHDTSTKPELIIGILFGSILLLILFILGCKKFRRSVQQIIEARDLFTAAQERTAAQIRDNIGQNLPPSGANRLDDSDDGNDEINQEDSKHDQPSNSRVSPEPRKPTKAENQGSNGVSSKRLQKEVHDALEQLRPLDVTGATIPIVENHPEVMQDHVDNRTSANEDLRTQKKNNKKISTNEVRRSTRESKPVDRYGFEDDF